MRGSHRLKAPVDVRAVNLDPLTGHDGKVFLYDDHVTLEAGGRLEEMGRCGRSVLLMYVAPHPSASDPPSGLLTYVHEQDVALIAEGKYPMWLPHLPRDPKAYDALPPNLAHGTVIHVPCHREVPYFLPSETSRPEGSFYRPQAVAHRGWRVGWGVLRYGGRVRIVDICLGLRTCAQIVYVAWPPDDPRVRERSHCPLHAYAKMAVDDLLNWEVSYRLRHNAEVREKLEIRTLLSNI